MVLIPLCRSSSTLSLTANHFVIGLGVEEPFNLKHIIMSSYYPYCTWNPMCCSKSKCTSDRKVFLPLVIPFFQCESWLLTHDPIVYLRTTMKSCPCLEWVSLEHLLPASVGSPCSEPLSLGQRWGVPFIFCLSLPQSPSSVAKAVWCLPTSHRAGQWLLHLVLHMLPRVSEDVSALYPGNWHSVYIFLKISIYTDNRQKFQHTPKLFFLIYLTS